MFDLDPTLSCKGRLLVATPPLGDPNFDRTVVYVLEHTIAGAIGVVLNRPLGDRCPPSLDEWHPMLSTPTVLFSGGPVDRAALIGVARIRRADASYWRIVSKAGDIAIASVDLAGSPANAHGEITAVRLFSGYSGWGPSQLDTELAMRAWMVFDAIDDDVFSNDPENLWRRVVRRQGGRTAWAADAPDDLSDN